MFDVYEFKMKWLSNHTVTHAGSIYFVLTLKVSSKYGHVHYTSLSFGGGCLILESLPDGKTCICVLLLLL